jgi:DNA-binding transcriptional ArsR family regulator
MTLLTVGTKGGGNRVKIIDLIKSNPASANQIASKLRLDYKTVLRHLSILSGNGIVVADNKQSYGAVYFLTPLMEKTLVKKLNAELSVWYLVNAILAYVKNSCYHFLCATTFPRSTSIYQYLASIFITFL